MSSSLAYYTYNPRWGELREIYVAEARDKILRLLT